MSAYSYDDFRVAFTPRAEGGFEVRARDDEGAITTGTFSVPLSETELERSVLQFARGRSPGATRRATVTASADTASAGAAVSRDVGGEQPPTMDAERLGEALADALLGGDIGAAYEHARSRAEHRGRGLRLSLSLADAPSLLSVPWEFLYRRPRFLASQRRTPLVRLFDTGALEPPPAIDDKVRILGVVASPSDLAPLDVDAERTRVEQALAAVVDAGSVELDWLEPATPRRLRQALRDGNYHVLHYVGHSDFTATGNGVLFLENGTDGRSVTVDDTLFANLLSDQNLLRLVVLNSCEGARTTLTDPYAGVATTLIQLGVPAVVAMQFEISDAAAILFAEELYTNLIGRQDPIDASVAEARKAIYTEVDKVEWATPVLFVRDPDVELFRFEKVTPSVPSALPAPDAVGVVDEPVVEPVPSDGRRRRMLWAAALIGASLLVIVAVLIGRRILDDDASTASTTTTIVGAPAWPSLRIGAEGPTVEALQLLLNAHGHDVVVDGFFGDSTLAAVEALEADSGIPVDGEVGRVTWQQLVVPVRRGQRGDAVRAAQLMLNENGVDVAVDGRFTLDMQDEVVRFQQRNGLNVDGIVDAETWQVLVAGAVAPAS